MIDSTVHLERISLADIAILDTFPLEPEALAFAGGTAGDIRDRIAEHRGPRHHHLFLIRSGQEAVGFLSLREGNARPDWAHEDAITLHNFRIGRPWRGRGFGRAAVLACCHWMIEHRPEAARLDLSVNEANARAIQFYGRCGFAPTGALHAGRLGREIIMSLGVGQP